MMTPMLYFTGADRMLMFAYYCTVNIILILFSVTIHKLIQDPGAFPERIRYRALSLTGLGV